MKRAKGVEKCFERARAELIRTMYSKGLSTADIYNMTGTAPETIESKLSDDSMN